MRLLCLSVLLGACSASTVPKGADTDTGASPGGGDPGEYAYDLSRLLQVEIELDPADWEILRAQERNLMDLIGGEDCIAEAWESPYDWFIGTVTIDGEELQQVEVRKKGLIGSQSRVRPSLKLDFNDHIDEQEFDGLTRLTLNNGNQDASRIVPCLGYGLYADAGLPASRCSYARVVVNGEDLGVYANVEPVKDPLLERHFGSSDGHLFEGALSDFREDWDGSFEDKNEDGDFAPIEAVTAALASDDPVGEVAKHVDLDAYRSAWAMEVLIGHWDSYSGNTNNFYLYVDPADGQMHFIPWGIDAILKGREPFGEDSSTAIVASAALPAALAASSEERARYYDALDVLLAEVWDEDVLEARLEAAVELTADWVWPDGDDDGAWQDSVDLIDDFIGSRRAVLDAERSSGDPAADLQQRELPCLTDQGSIEVTFATSWGTLGVSPTSSTGSNDWALTYQGTEIPISPLGSVAGWGEGAGVLFLTGQLEDGASVGIYAYSEDATSAFTPGEQALWDEAPAYLVYSWNGSDESWQTWAYLGGSLSLSEAGTSLGDAVVGGFRATIFAGE